MSEPQLVLPDANALVALCVTNHLHHRDAHAFLATVESWATTPVTEAALYRLLLNPQVTTAEHSVADVDAVVRGFRRDPRWRFLADDTTLAAPVVRTAVLVGHRQVTDLHLVNLAAQHGARLATFDRALLSWLDPADRVHAMLIAPGA